MLEGQGIYSFLKVDDGCIFYVGRTKYLLINRFLKVEVVVQVLLLEYASLFVPEGGGGIKVTDVSVGRTGNIQVETFLRVKVMLGVAVEMLVLV